MDELGGGDGPRNDSPDEGLATMDERVGAGNETRDGSPEVDLDNWGSESEKTSPGNELDYLGDEGGENSSGNELDNSDNLEDPNLPTISDEELEALMNEVDLTNLEGTSNASDASDADSSDKEWSDKDLEPDDKAPEEVNPVQNDAEDPDAKEEDLNENIPEDWARIEGEHTIGQDLARVNPNFDPDKNGGTENNCQRCAPAYDMCRRGYDVEAKEFLRNDYLSSTPEAAYENPQIQTTTGNGKADIESKMQEWGDGSRCEIAVHWKGGGGHVFNAEQVNGQTRFVDAQSNNGNVEWYFDHVKDDGSVYFFRTDNAKPSKAMLDCCKERTK